MNDLIKRHYEATKKRDLITDDTPLDDFLQKISEEYSELGLEFCDIVMSHDKEIGESFVHEAVDLVATTINMLTHFGFDFMAEYRKNVEHQESRI